jgi:hypothetical protein
MFRNLALIATLSLMSPTAALAQDGAAGSWAFSLGAGTDNRSKAASKSDGGPYGWGQAEWSSADGMVYAGPGFETIKSSTGSELEFEVGAGVRPQFAGFDIDLNATHKWQVNADPGADAEAWEFTAEVSRSIGPANASVELQHSPDGTGSTEAWTWLEGRVGWDFTEALSASAAIGRREQDNAIDYTGYDIGVTYALNRSLDLDLRWYGTDAEVPGEQYADALVAEISVSF